MKYPFLASFLVLCAVFYHNNRKADRNREKSKKAYLDRESRANATRKQPVDKLDYISVPLDDLPCDVCPDDPVIAECLADLMKLAEEKIVNFTGLTNTDLKLEYGVANLPFLEKCDLSYTHLIRVLNTWASRLYEHGFKDKALIVLEYAVNIHADISNIYYLAADIYIENGTPEKIDPLIETAGNLNSVIKNSIIKTLKEKKG
ncbi:MAG: hypothetical protein K6G69_06080 [Lachnospiraceae bacterium]|nr:hypothetical protein [Lachnospiraceae bacterium]